MKANNIIGSTEDTSRDEELLNDIEAATKRIFHQSKGLNEESKSHIILLNKAETEMTMTSLQLKAESAHTVQMRKAKNGICWMYGVIVLELIILVLLLYIGLSNS